MHRWKLVILLLVLAFGAQAGSVALGQDAAGTWRGRWTADATNKIPEHGGPLRVRLVPTGGNTYRGYFSGRFALVVPYFYRADVIESGNWLYSSKKLGPFGQYSMQLNQCGGQASGRWLAGRHAGSIQLHRK